MLVAPPGSGKTTVVPLRLVDEPWVEGRKIVVLEPRRLATRAAARRMAELVGEQVGSSVGYVTRTDRATGPNVRVEVVTEGILTRRLQTDPGLMDTAAVVFDEFHERNLQTDLGLALALHAKALLRPDLRILVMSATLDASAVAQAVDAPVVTSDARTHPVEIRWRPPPPRGRPEDHVARIVSETLATDEGDILVFLPGMAQIDAVARRLHGAAEIHRLHGSLPIADQDQAIRPGTARKVVLSTDIAESSLTVEGVSIVVDSGLARAPRFDARTGMTRLATVGISKASADQRAGRAGRLGPGVAVRLWSKMEHAARRPDIEPEIRSVDLAGFVLDLLEFGVEEPASLVFLDPPPPSALAEARSLLAGLGLVVDGRMTDTGRVAARLPVHPRLGRMIAEAGRAGWTACVLAALLADRDVLGGRPDERPVDLALRVAVVVEGRRDADRRALERVEREARDLAERAGVTDRTVDLDRVGWLTALAFPDRLAVRRGTPGRFRLRIGSTAWVPSNDSLAAEQFLVAADLDGRRKDARIRLAAPIDAHEVTLAFSSEVEESTELTWEGDRVVERTARRLGGIVFESFERPAPPGDEVREMVLARIRAEGLGWPDSARSLLARVAHLHARDPARWPDWSVERLESRPEDWLAAWITGATGLADVRALDLTEVLRSTLGREAKRLLDRHAPSTVRLPSGREAPVDYSGSRPVVEGRVQEFFGSIRGPEVGGVPVVIRLLSPAGRPVQITDDLEGFWAGSWADVKKEMAGRYPKHDWPDDPARATPHRR